MKFKTENGVNRNDATIQFFEVFIFGGKGNLITLLPREKLIHLFLYHRSVNN